MIKICHPGESIIELNNIQDSKSNFKLISNDETNILVLKDKQNEIGQHYTSLITTLYGKFYTNQICS